MYPTRRVTKIRIRWHADNRKAALQIKSVNNGDIISTDYNDDVNLILDISL
jgi:hypothetical protein